MHIAIKANKNQREEILSKKILSDIQITFVENGFIDADVYFDLLFDEINFSNNPFIQDKIVFANAVITTCKELPENYIRINAWNGFLKRDIIEICASNKKREAEAAKILNTLNWKFRFVPDIPGMIAARIISTIINEAYFGLGDKISTKEEIDIAMKLGTNYPYGPFEWAEKIGVQKIFYLLKKMQQNSERYKVAPGLAGEIRL